MRSSSIGVGPKSTGGCPLRNRKGDNAGGGDGKADDGSDAATGRGTPGATRRWERQGRRALPAATFPPELYESKFLF